MRQLRELVVDRRRQTFVPRWLLVVALVVAACGTDDTAVVSDAPATSSQASTWQELPASPLPERTRAVLAWTGSEALVLGGDRFYCPPNASCSGPLEPPLTDGAAFDVGRGTWRELSDAPVGFHSAASAVVIGDDVFVLAYTDYEGGVALLQYRISDDEWAEIPPPSDDLVWHRLVAAGDRLVAYVASEETGVTGDAVLDPSTGEWLPLPTDPMTPAFDRTMIWVAPYLYLFDKENVPNPGSERPSIVRAARLALGEGAWERLPDSEIIGGWGPWLVESDRLVTPLLGGADGGEVNGWGRTYPNGGVFDIASSTWDSLPDPPVDASESVGAVGASSAVFLDTHGMLLDVVTGRWSEVNQIPGVGDQEPALVMAAGRDAIAFARNKLWLYATQ